MGRPSEYTEELATYISDQLSEGRSLLSICKEKTTPSRSTVLRWMQENQDFRALIARAREDQADYFLDRQIDIADSATIEDYLLRKFQADNLKWVAAKLAPKKYGDKQAIDVTGNLTLGQLVEASAKKDV